MKELRSSLDVNVDGFLSDALQVTDHLARYLSLSLDCLLYTSPSPRD